MRRNPAAAARHSRARLMWLGHSCPSIAPQKLRLPGAVCKLIMAVDSNTIALASAAHACWSCGDMRAAQFCKACGKVQPPEPVDYFSFFGLPRKLNIDTSTLEHEFYSLSRKLHPDIYA